MVVVGALPRAPASLRAAVSLHGPPALAEPLAEALRCQWAFGFPAVPRGLSRLTHGFLHYPAGLQAVSAQHLLGVLPPGLLLDPFVGGGTTLVEALRSGRQAMGADTSPLALFAARHHTWCASDVELADLAARAAAVVDTVGRNASSRAAGGGEQLSGAETRD